METFSTWFDSLSEVGLYCILLATEGEIVSTCTLLALIVVKAAIFSLLLQYTAHGADESISLFMALDTIRLQTFSSTMTLAITTGLGLVIFTLRASQLFWCPYNNRVLRWSWLGLPKVTLWVEWCTKWGEITKGWKDLNVGPSFYLFAIKAHDQHLSLWRCVLAKTKETTTICEVG